MRNRMKLPLPDHCLLYQALLWVSHSVRPIDDDLFLQVPPPATPKPTDDDKRELLAAILSGHLKAMGKWGVDNEGTFAELERETVELPADPWELDMSHWEIYWEGSSMHPPDYFGETTPINSITVKTDQLMAVFPPPPDSGKLTADTPRTATGGDNSPAPTPTKRGRPPSYDWPEFHAEIAVRADLDNLPETQAELEKDMADWCQDKWGEIPATSTIRDKISPIYKHKRKAGK